jgi:adenylate cyclase
LDIENSYSKEPRETKRSESDRGKREGINTREEKLLYQQQSVLNLYNCGIAPEVIALQLDITEIEVNSIIRKVLIDDKRKEKSIKEISDSPSIGMFYLDAVIDIERLINDAQKRMWKALKLEPKFNIPLEQTQEMSLLISTYGGHVFKYVGDALLAFFFVSDNNLYLPCSNAVNCAQTMIRIIQDGINPILNEYDYPEMGVRIGIDIGENVVVQYGWGTNSYTVIEDNASNQINNRSDEKAKYYIENNEKVIPMTTTATIDSSDDIKTSRIIRKPHLDVLGYTTSIAAKMTGFTAPNQITIGQSVYKILDSVNKNEFKKLNISKDDWNYVSPSTGNIYSIYSSINGVT